MLPDQLARLPPADAGHLVGLPLAGAAGDVGAREPPVPALGGAFWVPARAIRWTQTHVMVVITDDALTTREHIVWLRAADVRRRLPAEPAGPR